MKSRSIFLIAVLVPFCATACRQDAGQSHVTGSPDSVDATGLDALAGIKIGEVVETMNAGSYTYVQIDTGVEEIWAAAPVCEVKLGERLGVSTEMPMRRFASPTLEREFDLVYFVGAFLNPDGSSRAMASHGAKAQGAMGRSAGPTDVDVGEIERAEGGKTVAEIYAEKTELAGKEVKLRGKVTKYTPEILGKNWLHVQDGTGDALARTHDVTVTTSAAAQMGDTVLVTGTVQLDKDLGLGYKYAVIIEDAQVVVEP